MGAGEVSADSADWRRWRFPTHACGDPVSQGKLGGARRIELGGNAPVFRAGSSRASYVLLLAGSVRVQVIGEGARKAVPSQVLPGQWCALTTRCILRAMPLRPRGG